MKNILKDYEQYKERHLAFGDRQNVKSHWLLLILVQVWIH